MSDASTEGQAEQSLVLARDHLAGVIALWLSEKAGRTNSERTEVTYRETLLRFRADLRARGYDLTSPEEIVTTFAQHWAATPWDSLRRRAVRSATYNQRLAILSSFYTFAQRRFHVVASNPIAALSRRPVQPYGSARPLDPQTVTHALASVDRTTLAGKRDYALLTLAFTTGRRRQELAALRWRDLSIGGTLANPVVTLSFAAKGGKQMRDTLDPAVAEALLAYLGTIYGQSALSLTVPGETPIWRSFAPKHYERVVALGQQGIADIFSRWLGTSKVHTSRHTFAREMIQSGAPVTELQARLGHRSLATTGIYASELGGSENAYVGTLAKRLGIRGHTPNSDSER